MSKRFAILENDIVTNLVVSEEEIYLELVLPDGTVFVEETSETGPASMGRRYSHALNKFEQIRTSQQWTWDESTFEWIAPVDYPSDGKIYAWSDEDSNWVEFTPHVSEVIIPETSAP